MENPYKKIRAGIVLQSYAELHIPEFREKVTDYEAFFKDLFLEKINNLIGPEGWGIFFTQANPLTNYFLVDIYTDNIGNAGPIENIIKDGIDADFSFEYFYRGDIDSYLKR